MPFGPSMYSRTLSAFRCRMHRKLLKLTRTFCVVKVTAFILVSILGSMESFPCRCLWGWCGGPRGNSPISAVLFLMCCDCVALGRCLFTYPTWPGSGCSRWVWSLCPGSVLLAVEVLKRSVCSCPSAGWPPVGCLLLLLLLLCSGVCVPLLLGARCLVRMESNKRCQQS